MSDYIEREAALALVEPDARPFLAERISQIPAADVRPAVRGKWVAEKEDVEWGCSTIRYRCSHCGRLPHFDKESFKFLLSDFCPKCGADMREANDEKA